MARLEQFDPSLRLSSEKEQAEHITLVMVGDTGFAPSRAKPLEDRVYKYGRKLSFAETTAKIRAEINGDINFANMESVVSDSHSLRPTKKKYNFVTHPNGVRHLVDIGFNLFSMANNHSYDYGSDGIRESLRHLKPLRSKGLLGYAGIGADRVEAGNVVLFDRKTFRVAFGAIGIGGSGAKRAGKKKPGQLNIFHASDQALIASNLKKSSSDLKLLSVHYGRERSYRAPAHEVSLMRNLMEKSTADVLIGHHAHVARGIEIRNGRLLVYGLGNFNHQGTANMNGKSGCMNYSLLVRAHFVREGKAKPALAAVEVLPINSTHMQPRRIAGRRGAQRIAILNGLARSLDRPSIGAKGVRFMAQDDGSGLHCTASAKRHPFTRQLCSNHDVVHLASAAAYRQALASCGSRAAVTMIARANVEQSAPVAKIALERLPVAARRDAISPARVQVTLLGQGNGLGQTDAVISDTATSVAAIKVARQLEQNPDHWPRGMPLAWLVPDDETGAQKRSRWKSQHYSVVEVERLLKKRGLIK